MRKKIAGGVGLVVVMIVSIVLAVWWMTPAELPLRIGMTERQVDELLGLVPSSEDEGDGEGQGEGTDGRISSSSSHDSELAEPGAVAVLSVATYTVRLRIISITSQDWLGNNRKVTIHFDEGLVSRLETESLPRTCPPWLTKAINAVGW